MDNTENNLFMKRLKKIMDIRNLKQVELVDKTGISKSAISQYLSGEFAPKQNYTYKLAEALNVDPAWLMGKNVDMEGNKLSKKAISCNTKPVPLLGTIAAGTPILAEQNIEDYFNIDSRIKVDFALKIKGNSMTGAGIHPGDIVFLRQQCALENGEIGAVLIENEATLKKFYRDNDTVVLQAENDSFKPIILTEGNVKILGKLVAVLNIRE